MTTNVVCIEGEIVGQPRRVELPGGNFIWQFELQVDKDCIPCRVDNSSFLWPTGSKVMVVGNIKSRYFRVGGATRRKVEVLANVITRGDT